MILNNNQDPPPPYSVPKLLKAPNINMKIKEHTNINKHKNRGNHKRVQPGIKTRVDKFNNKQQHY